MATIPINELKRVVGDGLDELLSEVGNVLASGWWLNGNQTKNFCEAFASYIGVKDCLAVANGTDALEIAMRAILDVRKRHGKEVITVANAGGYSSIACRLIGLTPVYADIEEATQLVSPDSVVAALSPETALVVVTHLYGSVIDVLHLRLMMDRAGYDDVPIIEDCAQAHGVRLDGRVAGSMGDIATFSFYPTKNLGAFGDGGAIVSSDADLVSMCRQLHQYGWNSKYTISVPYGRNSRMDEVQAAFLNHLLPGLDLANTRRLEILDRYAAASPSDVHIVRGSNGTVAHLAVALCDRRDELRRYLTDNGVQSDIHYPVLDCDQLGWKDLPQRISPTGLPVSRASVSRLLTLPCFPGLTDVEVQHVCGVLSAWKT